MAKTYHTVMALADLPEREGRCVQVGPRMIALFRTAEGLFAIDHTCPHMGGPLAFGFVNKGKVHCPLHGWDFDLRTGLSSNHAAAVAVYEVRVEGNEVQIGIED
jgi:nitrite reductase (NADH) small subunit